MNDLEICKRIAEIEELEVTQITSSCVFVFNNSDSCQYFKEKVYNPLKDDALCFKLMVKHKIDFNHSMFTNGTLNRYEAVNTETGIGFGYNENPNVAICLAIIEANK